MPEDLWREAVALARREGVSPVARALGVDCGTLRERVRRTAAGGCGGAARSAGFVEVEGAPVVGGSTAAGAVVDMTRADGTRVTVELAPGVAVDVLGLAAALLGRV
jgi:transposase-like protein